MKKLALKIVQLYGDLVWIVVLPSGERLHALFEILKKQGVMISKSLNPLEGERREGMIIFSILIRSGLWFILWLLSAGLAEIDAKYADGLHIVLHSWLPSQRRKRKEKKQKRLYPTEEAFRRPITWTLHPSDPSMKINRKERRAMKISRADWEKKGRELYGKDRKIWEWKCPHCNRIQSYNSIGAQMKKGETSQRFGILKKGNRIDPMFYCYGPDCNWSANGLFHTDILLIWDPEEPYDEARKKNCSYVFPFGKEEVVPNDERNGRKDSKRDE